MNWKLIRQVYLSVYWNQRNASSMWVTWFVFIVAAGLASIPLIWHGEKNPWPLALIIFTGISCLNLFLWWMLLVSTLMQQCSPQNARLTPGLRTAAMQAFTLAWLTSTLLFSFLFFLAAGHFILLFLGAGIFLPLVALATSRRNWLIAIPLYSLSMYFPYLKKFSIEWGLRNSDPLASTIATATLLIFLALCMKGIFGMKGDRAFALQAKLKKQPDITEIGMLINRPATGWSKFFGSQWLYDALLKRALHRRTHVSTSGNASLLKFAFGFALHWSYCAGMLINFSLLLLAIGVVAQIFPGMEINKWLRVNPSAFSYLITLPSMIVAMLSLNALYSTHKEQAILRLLPGVPQDRDLNRAIAGLYIHQSLVAMAGGAILAAFFYWLRPFQGVNRIKEMNHAILFCTISPLPLIAFRLRNYASMRKPHHTGVLLYFFPLVPMVATIIASQASGASPFLFWLWMGLFITASAILLAMRWKLAVNGPVALPVGRLEI